MPPEVSLPPSGARRFAARHPAGSWSKADQKAVVLAKLQRRGVFLEILAEEVGRDYDAFDLVSHVAFDQPPPTRKERAKNVRKRNYFTRYGLQARAAPEALLAKYADTGIADLESPRILHLNKGQNEWITADGFRQRRNLVSPLGSSPPDSVWAPAN